MTTRHPTRIAAAAKALKRQKIAESTRIRAAAKARRFQDFQNSVAQLRIARMKTGELRAAKPKQHRCRRVVKRLPPQQPTRVSDDPLPVKRARRDFLFSALLGVHLDITSRTLRPPPSARRFTLTKYQRRYWFRRVLVRGYYSDSTRSNVQLQLLRSRSQFQNLVKKREQLMDDFRHQRFLSDPRAVERFHSAVSVLQAEAEKHNQLMHSLNGNIAATPMAALERIESQRVAEKWQSTTLPDLAGASVVLSQALHGVILTDAREPLGPNHFPEATTWKEVILKGDGSTTSVNSYRVSYPSNAGRAINDVEEKDIATFRLLGSNTDLDSVRVGINRELPLPKPLDLINSPSVRKLFSDNVTPSDIEEATSAMSVHRFGGIKGKRQIVGWDSLLIQQGAAYTNLARIDARGFNYKRFGFWLLARLWESSIASTVIPASQNGTVPAMRPMPIDSDEWNTTTIDLAYMTPARRAHKTTPVHPMNTVRFYHMFSSRRPASELHPYGPEDVLLGWSTDANDRKHQLAKDIYRDSCNDPLEPHLLMQALDSGEAAFIDATNLTTTQVRIAVEAMAPQHHTGYYFSPTGATGAHEYRSPFGRFSEIDDTTGYTRNGAEHIIIYHSGPAFASPRERAIYEAETFGIQSSYYAEVTNPPAPEGDGETVNVTRFRRSRASNSSYGKIYTPSEYMDVIRHWMRHHHAGSSFWAAHDMLMYRTVLYKPSDSPAALENAPNSALDSFAQRGLHLPRDLSATAYFDVFRGMATLPGDAPELSGIMGLQRNKWIWHCIYACHANAVAINWASFAYSMCGFEWAPLTSNTPTPRRVLRNLMTTRLREYEITPWMTVSATATGYMYGFAPMNSTLRSTDQEAAPGVWQNNLPIYLANPYHEAWALETIPRHMVLPLKNGTPTWPTSSPLPMINGYERLAPKVRLGGDSAVDFGLPFLAEGGFTANAQYMVAVGTRDSLNGTPRWRTDGAYRDDLVLGSWDTPHQYEWPTNPSRHRPTWMAPSNSIFGNYIVPGSIRSYNSSTHSVKAVGITCVAADLNDIMGTHYVTANSFSRRTSIHPRGRSQRRSPHSGAPVLQDPVTGAWAGPPSVGSSDPSLSPPRSPSPSAPLVPPQCAIQDYRRSWANMIIDKSEAAVSIAYIAPSGYLAERIPEATPFSLLLWQDRSADFFTGITYAAANDTTVDLPPPPALGASHTANPFADMPAYLRNHNWIHAPEPRRTNYPPPRPIPSRAAHILTDPLAHRSQLERAQASRDAETRRPEHVRDNNDVGFKYTGANPNNVVGAKRRLQDSAMPKNQLKRVMNFINNADDEYRQEQRAARAAANSKAVQSDTEWLTYPGPVDVDPPPVEQQPNHQPYTIRNARQRYNQKRAETDPKRDTQSKVKFAPVPPKWLQEIDDEGLRQVPDLINPALPDAAPVVNLPKQPFRPANTNPALVSPIPAVGNDGRPLKGVSNILEPQLQDTNDAEAVQMQSKHLALPAMGGTSMTGPGGTINSGNLADVFEAQTPKKDSGV
uniref:Putative structural protein n=1 Tax=Rosellinia necatrix fusagravirus 2 TaxID=2056543 RepID=A0A2Z5WAE0_9VIRU|nr:putative structural protein [Rosellinia necatrix fusagravirus 2]